MDNEETIILTETHLFKPSHDFYAELDHLCFLSKNLYNATLYKARQSFFAKSYKNFNQLNAEFVHNNQPDYRALPAKVAKHTQKMVDANFHSFFALLKKREEGYEKKVKLPKYLHTVKGRQVVSYEKGAISKKALDQGLLSLSGTTFQIPTKATRENIQASRIVPCNGYIKVEVLYKQSYQTNPVDDNIAGIDLGVNNLMTIVYANNYPPMIINGRPLKSVNQFYNKNKADYQSQLESCNDKYTSNRLQNLSFKRNNKVNDYLHRSTTFLTNQLVANHVSMVVIGYNKDWKQDVNNGKKNNQNFVTIPHLRLVEMLEYKCKLKGVTVVRTEESYTSKSSFLDKDYLPTYSPMNKNKHQFSGKRVERGLYVTKEGLRVNADVNGAYNIMRKVVGERIYDLVDVRMVSKAPHRYTIDKEDRLLN